MHKLLKIEKESLISRLSSLEQSKAERVALDSSSTSPLREDANIFNSDINFTDTLQANNYNQVSSQASLVKTLAVQKKLFSSNSLDWLRFKQAFEHSTTLGNYSDSENVSRLYSFLRAKRVKLYRVLL